MYLMQHVALSLAQVEHVLSHKTILYYYDLGRQKHHCITLTEQRKIDYTGI